jgi:hypothetical protein
MIRRPIHMISSLTQMTMDAHLYRIFTQSKLHVRAADKPVMLPNNKDQCPFTVTAQSIKMCLSSPLLTLFFSFIRFRTILPSFPTFAPSVCLYFICIFPFYFSLSSSSFLYWPRRIPFFFSVYFLLFCLYLIFPILLLFYASLYLCKTKFNESCLWYVEKLTSRTFFMDYYCERSGCKGKKRLNELTV